MTHRKLIYRPSGRAGEYADKGYAVNLYRGCTHGCLYCFSPSVLHMSRESFHASCVAMPDILERLQADMRRVGILPEPIFLCFTTDPYCIDAPEGFTREAIKIIQAYGNRVNILTKGGMRACKDFDLLASRPGNKIGATLTFASGESSHEWEPKSELPSGRLGMLKAAWAKGISTWVSVEPVIDPEESLLIMEGAIPYVDEFKIGRWNHDARASAIDWKDFAEKAKALMEKHGKKYMFKQELRECL